MTTIPTERVLASIDGVSGYEAFLGPHEDVQMVRGKPDPAWQYHDGRGHFHALAEGGTTPTLESYLVDVERHEYCPPEYCEGHDVEHWCCRLCGEVVEPGFVFPRHVPDSELPVVTARRRRLTLRGTGTPPGTQSTGDGKVTIELWSVPKRVTVRVQRSPDRTEPDLFGTGLLLPPTMHYQWAGKPWWALLIHGIQLVPYMGTKVAAEL